MTDYTQINGTYSTVVPEKIREVLKEMDELFDQDLDSSPCAYVEVKGPFNLVDSSNADLFEYNVHKHVTTFNTAGSLDGARVLLTYTKLTQEEISFVINGNNIDGFYVFNIV